jgi:hypothetical protein
MRALVPGPALRAALLTRPLAPDAWRPLSQAAQARLRYSFMRTMAWCDWDGRPAWWWTTDHRTLTELKMLCGRM